MLSMPLICSGLIWRGWGKGRGRIRTIAAARQEQQQYGWIPSTIDIRQAYCNAYVRQYYDVASLLVNKSSTSQNLWLYMYAFTQD